MLVFNLTEQPLVYRKRSIPPNGGSFNFRDLRVVPLRDQKLSQGPGAILAFGELPSWFLEKQAQVTADRKAQAAKATPPPAMAAVPKKATATPAPAPAEPSKS